MGDAFVQTVISNTVDGKIPVLLVSTPQFLEYYTLKENSPELSEPLFLEPKEKGDSDNCLSVSMKGKAFVAIGDHHWTSYDATNDFNYEIDYQEVRRQKMVPENATDPKAVYREKVNSELLVPLGSRGEIFLPKTLFLSNWEKYTLEVWG